MADRASSDDLTLATNIGQVASSERRAHLIVISGTNVGQVYSLVSDHVLIGREDGAEVQIMDAGISRRHAQLVRGDDGYVLSDAGSRNGTYVNSRKLDGEHVLQDGDRVRVGVLTVLKFSYEEGDLEANYAQQMYENALRDALTGVYNRRYFDERLLSEFSFSIRHQTLLALLLVDLDHFKHVNDTHGHLAGDKVLIEFCKLVAQTIRVEDVLARYGGEEFALILRNTDLQNATTLAERIRGQAAKHRFTIAEGVTLQITVSAGVVALPNVTLQTPEALVRAADDALYEAKARGRNCVVTHQVLR